MPTKPQYKGHVVKLGDEAHARLLALQQVILARGWQVVGVTGVEKPTLAAVLGMAIAQVSDMVAELAAEKKEG